MRVRAALVLLAMLGWGGLAWLALLGLADQPPTAGFDLALLLEAGQRVASGASPYDPAMLAGASPSAEDLFYSYPPPVAQAASLIAGVPLGVALAGWALVAAGGLALVAWLLARRGRPADPVIAVLATMALAPFLFPFAIGVLFGNLDAAYPLLYGAVLLAVLPGSGRGAGVAAGVALALASLAKLHPAVIGLWLLVRVIARHPERSTARLAVAAALVTVAVVVGGSLATFGIDPWTEYGSVIRAGSGADVVDPRNIAPVSLLGQLVAMDAGSLRLVQLAVTAVAAAVALAAAWRIADPVASFAVATVASLAVLPVTWYHYPVALIPSAMALVLLRPAARPWVAAAALVGTLAVGWLPATWLGVGLLMVALTRPAARPVPMASRALATPD